MDLELAGKTVVITGGTKGIGFACAVAFVAEGARVGIVSRSQQNVDSACGELSGVFGMVEDLSDAAEAQRCVDTMEGELGPVGVLVNSAGAARRTPPDDLSPSIYRAAMDAKFFSYVNVIDPVVKRMAARESGVIINVIGNGGKIASPVHVPGGAANAGLMLVTAGLAAAYAERGVRIVAVNPGLTDTSRVAEGLQADAATASISEAEARQRSVARIPMGRLADPQEIARVVVFLASAQASYVTGVAITMDGSAAPIIV